MSPHAPPSSPPDPVIPPAKTPDPIVELITAYDELNAATVDELHEEPSPLEFMRYVARNAPFVVRRGARDWPAVRRWSAAALRDAMAGSSVNVAVTPFGNADAPTPDPHPTTQGVDAAGGDSGTNNNPQLLFAKPLEEDQPFGEFLDYVIRQEKQVQTQRVRPGERAGAEEVEVEEEEVRYAQTQNDNLRNEYAALFAEVPPSIPWARIALQRDPDAINLWIGNSRSVTALHKDNYENVYVQVRGRKHFVLLPGHCQPCVAECQLSPASYVRDGASSTGGLRLQRESGADPVPFATWDPDDDAALDFDSDYDDDDDDNNNKVKHGSTHPLVLNRRTPYSALARPIRVTLNPGDMLYLPAMWYHKVSQSCSDEGICVAVNYWYDMEFSGPLYPLSSFVRNVNLVASKE